MNNQANTQVNINMIRRIATGLFCTFIGFVVLMVLLHLYDPSQSTLRAVASVSMDVVCMVILLILISSFAFTNYVVNQTTRLYALLLLGTIWAMFLDFLNWAFDGSLAFGRMTYWFTLGSLCMGSILVAIFSMYLSSYFAETHGLKQIRIRGKICAIINLCFFVLTLILALSKMAFKYVDGHYETGALYDLVTAVPILSILYLTALTIRHVKKIGIHDVLAVVGYILFMVAGALLESEYCIGTTYVAVAIADIFIFVMLQNEMIENEKTKAQKWMLRSHTDELTGLFNRYAFENDMKVLDNSDMDDELIFISFDVNSLKRTNDSLGHSAGDELLVGASECLRKCFGAYGKLYRVGGDEFIAIIYANDQQLASMLNELEQQMKSWHGHLAEELTISYGYARRSEDKSISIKEMSLIADKRMYENKRAYYQKFGN